MLSTDRLREFVAVVDQQSISAGARKLGVPRATLSRRITALETDLSVRLMHRNTRRLVMTEAGQELYRRARRIVSDTDAAWAAVQRLDDVPRGLLRVSVASVFNPQLFIDFVRDYPEVELEVRVDTRHVDLVAEGIDVAVRFGPVDDAALIVRRLWVGDSIAVASPSYLARHGEPSQPKQLADHECIVGFAGTWAPRRAWPRIGGGEVAVGGRLTGNDVGLARDAAVAGLGIALLPRIIVADQLRDGSLVHVLRNMVGRDDPASIVYADREFIEPKVRAFVDRAAELLAKVGV
jgi:DNA-binding transcriptional LysR family regulator